MAETLLIFIQVILLSNIYPSMYLLPLVQQNQSGQVWVNLISDKSTSMIWKISYYCFYVSGGLFLETQMLDPIKDH